MRVVPQARARWLPVRVALPVWRRLCSQAARVRTPALVFCAALPHGRVQAGTPSESAAPRRPAVWAPCGRRERGGPVTERSIGNPLHHAHRTACAATRYLASSSFGALAAPSPLQDSTPLMVVALNPPDGTHVLVVLAGRGFAALQLTAVVEGPGAPEPTAGASGFVDPALVLLPPRSSRGAPQRGLPHGHLAGDTPARSTPDVRVDRGVHGPGRAWGRAWNPCGAARADGCRGMTTPSACQTKMQASCAGWAAGRPAEGCTHGSDPDLVDCDNMIHQTRPSSVDEIRCKSLPAEPESCENLCIFDPPIQLKIELDKLARSTAVL